MKGNISKNAQRILNDPNACKEFMDHVVTGAGKAARRAIKVGKDSFEVSSGPSMSICVNDK